jgi:hypothetical protein
VSGLVVLLVAVTVGLLVAISEAVLIAGQNTDLRAKLDRAINDRDASARAHSRSQLRKVASNLRRLSDCTADRALWRAYQDVADRIERETDGA